MSPTEATQARRASLTASFRVRLPLVTGTTSAPSSSIRNTLSSWRLGVDLAHVDDALHPEQGGGRGRGHPVLARPRLGDQLALAHPPGEQALAHHVVELVGAGVGQVLPLEQHPDAELLGQPAAFGDRGGSAAVVAEDAVELGPERRVGPGVAERRLEFDAGRHQGLGDVAPPEVPEPARSVPGRP